LEPSFYPDHDVFWVLRNMPAGIGALLGSLAGLLAVALAVWLGFRSLRRAYDDQAAIVRDDEQRRLRERRRSIAAALKAEIQAASTAMRAFLAANPRAAIVHEDARDAVISGYPDPTTRTYEALLKEIGLLGPELCGDLVDVYDMFERLNRTATTYRTMAPQNVEMVMNTHIESGVFRVYADFLQDIQRRLGAVAEGADDPGPSARVGRDPQTQRLRIIPLASPAMASTAADSPVAPAHQAEGRS
jgi:hypothetical protein